MSSKERGWEADRALDATAVRAAIASEFPEVDTSRITYLGSGWEFDVYATGDGWCFRFPRRAEYSTQFESERQTLSLVHTALGSLAAVPKVELWGSGGVSFPYPFAGHRTVPGRGADDPSVQRSDRLAADLGAMLCALHSIPEEEALSAGLSRETDGSQGWLVETRADAAGLAGISRSVDDALEWLLGVQHVPDAYEGPSRVVHNDLSPEHVLVDPSSGRLVGIIDWTDTALGDPVLDFIVLACSLGYSFVSEMLRSYGQTDPGFDERLTFQCRVRSLHWLATSIERGLDRKNDLVLVGNAFGFNNSR